MLGVFRHILYLLLAFVLQTTWVHYLGIFEIQPDLILLVLVFVAVAGGHLEATALGFVVGLCQDAYSPADLGLNALSKSLIGFAVGLGRGRLMADTIQVQIVIVASAVVIHDLIYYAGHSGVALSAIPYFLVRYSLGRALYTALLASVVAVGMQARQQLEMD